MVHDNHLADVEEKFAKQESSNYRIKNILLTMKMYKTRTLLTKKTLKVDPG